jgi:hypothetical protein
MKKTVMPIMMLVAASILLMACSDDAGSEKTHTGAEVSKSESKSDSAEISESDSGGEAEGAKSIEEADPAEDAPSAESGGNQSKGNEDNPLSQYSAKEIEYARVWLQVVGNSGTAEINVRHLSAGEPVNPYDDKSAVFPENVTVLAGDIMADGAVTYSGNGDGTINLYHIPSHWPSAQQIEGSMKDYTEEIISNTEKVYINPGDDEEVSKLIEKVNSHG